METDVELDEIKNRIAVLVSEYMDVDLALVLSGQNFNTLIENFDSLAMVEIQLLVEKQYGFDLDFEDMDKHAFPANIDELAKEFLQQYKKHQQKLALKKAKSEEIKQAENAPTEALPHKPELAE